MSLCASHPVTASPLASATACRIELSRVDAMLEEAGPSCNTGAAITFSPSRRTTPAASSTAVRAGSAARASSNELVPVARKVATTAASAHT